MRELAFIIGRFGALLGMAAFGAGIVLALLAGVDPLFAVVRAGGLATALVAFYALMCRTTVAWLDLGAAAPAEEKAAHPEAAAAPAE